MKETAYPVELTGPDIERYREGNTGIEWVWSFAGPEPGPHLVVNALTHGNELCGAVALDFLLRHGIRPRCGRLTLVFANIEAFRRFDPRRPTRSRCVDEDFNRLWSETELNGRRRSTELLRARALRSVYESADYLLDLHSMLHPGPPLALCGLTHRGRDLARALRFPSWIVADAGHPSGRRLLDYTPFADPNSRRTALLVECGQHWVAGTVQVAIETTLRLLLHLGMGDPAFAAPWLTAEPAHEPQLIEVTHVITAAGDGFTWVRDFAGLEVVPQAGTPLAHDEGRGIVTPYDDCVLIMPARQLHQGQTAVRLGRFVRS